MKLTFSLTYYNQGIIPLLKHIELWQSYPKEIKDRINFIIIDDCSKIPLEDLIKNLELTNLNLSLYRVEKDLYCNISGAMNLSAKECSTDWIIFLDMDTLITKNMASQLIKIIDNNDNGKVYKFNRVCPNDEKNLRHLKIHPKVCLIKKKDFWDIGGYDEDLVGYYGMTDPIFFYRAKNKVKTIFCNDIFLIHLEEGQSDINRDFQRNKKLFEEKKKNNNWCKDYIRFPWKKIF